MIATHNVGHLYYNWASRSGVTAICTP